MSVRRHSHHRHESAVTVKDPVCGMPVSPESAAESREVEGHTYYFCSADCATTFAADPARYITAHRHGAH